MTIDVQRSNNLSIADFQAVLRSSGLAARRPTDDVGRLTRMLEHSNLIIVAKDGGKIVGVARSVTEFSYCCYLSDLAVSKDHQGRSWFLRHTS